MITDPVTVAVQPSAVNGLCNGDNTAFGQWVVKITIIRYSSVAHNIGTANCIFGGWGNIHLGPEQVEGCLTERKSCCGRWNYFHNVVECKTCTFNTIGQCRRNFVEIVPGIYAMKLPTDDMRAPSSKWDVLEYQGEQESLQGKVPPDVSSNNKRPEDLR